MSQWKSIGRTFGYRVMKDPEHVQLTGPRAWQYQELTRACAHALGDDILVQVIGSRKRRTSTVLDYDMVKRRPDSKRADVPFTDEDKAKVASNLEKLPFVTSLTIGNIAIKFHVCDTMVDLVLWRERPEEFPRLRGSTSFEDNTACINDFLDESPVARDAIVTLKRVFPRARPKGILIEAMTWRLAVAGEIPFASSTEKKAYAANVCQSCLKMVKELVNWEWSPVFGRDLKQDLENLPDAKRDEYLSGLEKVRELGKDNMWYALLADALWRKVEHRYESKKMQLQSYYTIAERTFRECFDRGRKALLVGTAAVVAAIFLLSCAVASIFQVIRKTRSLSWHAVFLFFCLSCSGCVVALVEESPFAVRPTTFVFCTQCSLGVLNPWLQHAYALCVWA